MALLNFLDNPADLAGVKMIVPDHDKDQIFKGPDITLIFNFWKRS